MKERKIEKINNHWKNKNKNIQFFHLFLFKKISRFVVKYYVEVSQVYDIYLHNLLYIRKNDSKKSAFNGREHDNIIVILNFTYSNS